MVILHQQAEKGSPWIRRVLFGPPGGPDFHCFLPPDSKAETCQNWAGRAPGGGRHCTILFHFISFKSYISRLNVDRCLVLYIILDVYIYICIYMYIYIYVYINISLYCKYNYTHVSTYLTLLHTIRTEC